MGPGIVNSEPTMNDDAAQLMTTSRFYLYMTVFVAGMTTLAIEFTTSRLLQTVFGTSNIVWANVIGLVLLFLTIGYFLGGRLADQYPNPRIFYWLVTLAGFSGVFFLLLTSVILRSAAAALASVNISAIVSSLIAVFFALAVPVTLLGCISPFAIRLGVRNVGEAGRISGRMYAVSTWGSLLGTYLPVLLIIPTAGTRLAATLFGVLLLIVGLGGLWQLRRKADSTALLLILLLIPVVIAWNQGGIKQSKGQVYEVESAYNYIQVLEVDGCNYLLLNEGQAYHSFYCEGGRVPRVSVWSIMLAAPYFRGVSADLSVKNLAVIGLAAGTIPKQFTQTYGPIPIDGIELDPAIVEAGRQFFALNEPNINVIIGDGRYELNQLDDQYDVITLDAYKVPYIPWHLTTTDFFEEVQQHLTENGVLAVNVGRSPGDRRLVEAITATLLTVFPAVHTVDVPGSLNTILIATVQMTSENDFRRNIEDLAQATSPLLKKALTVAETGLVPTVLSDIVFTDQRAPVETIIDSMVIQYLLESGPSGLSEFGG
ncbi:MAG TPA: fused MFS/spermidine synthase [Patescibacteria group bacterium]|nr:fused MFS/spermidine synthase [Patescibacteria group bacterium]